MLNIGPYKFHSRLVLGTGKYQDFETMKKLVEELQQELYTLGASVYQQAGAPGQNPENASEPQTKSSEDGDDVIDAEFTETK